MPIVPKDNKNTSKVTTNDLKHGCPVMLSVFKIMHSYSQNMSNSTKLPKFTVNNKRENKNHCIRKKEEKKEKNGKKWKKKKKKNYSNYRCYGNNCTCSSRRLTPESHFVTIITENDNYFFQNNVDFFPQKTIVFCLIASFFKEIRPFFTWIL